MRILLWFAAAALTIACFVFQNRTGPTYPLEGTFETGKGPVGFKFLRSEEIGTGLSIMLRDPVPAGVAAKVRFRRFKSNDAWSETPMQPGVFRVSHRGSVEEISGVGATLPSLKERAGKYEYYVIVDGGAGSRSVTGERAIYARYKAPVPRAVLLVHILIVFLSMTLALRTGLEALRGGETRRLVWATVASLVAGAFVMGPVVQKYAFGVWWSGVPFGWDWTDNKVLVELAAWLLAAGLGASSRHARWARAAVIFATVVTLAIYFIPHSIFGSEFDYTSGVGRGTAG
jgi:hypothetical protein